MFQYAIAAMEIAGEYRNIPLWVADWPHCCDFKEDTCDDLRWSAMLLEAQNRREMAQFIAACGRAYTLSTKPVMHYQGTAFVDY